MDKMKELISGIVEDNQGMKAVDLALAVAKKIYLDKGYEESIRFDICEIIEEMVKENLLVEVEYVLPTMDYRVKSFILPVGTKIKMNGDGR